MVCNDQRFDLAQRRGSLGGFPDFIVMVYGIDSDKSLCRGVLVSAPCSKVFAANAALEEIEHEQQ